MSWIGWLAIAVAVVAVSLLILILLARRLPPGLAKDLAGFLPACATTLRALRKDPRVPRQAKIALAIAAVWMISPIDLIPEFLPIIGPLDDVIVVVLALRYAARQVPRASIEEAWPGERRLLDRLLGPRASRPGQSDSSAQITVEVQYTAECPHAAPIIDRLHQIIRTTAGRVTAANVIVEDGRPVPDRFAGSPTVLINGTNPFDGAPTEAPACALHPPTPDEVEAAIIAAL
jgi:uncharacterized membrane protein YkvA (DUF1232 family)